MGKISSYVSLPLASVHTDDLLVIVDVHDTTMAPSGTTKNITLANLGVPFLNANNAFTGANTFTGPSVPITVGASYATGQTQIYAGAIYLAETGSVLGSPTLNFYGVEGGAAGNNGWQFGIDTANHGGGKDFFLAKVVNGAATDLWFMNYGSGAMGLGAATPPSDNYLFQIFTPASSSVTPVGIGVGSSPTGHALDIHQSSGIPQLWIDNDMFWTSVAGGSGVQFKGEATNNVGILIANNAKTQQWTLSALPSGNVFELKYVTGGNSCFWGHTDGSVEFLHNVHIDGGIAFNHNIKFGNYTAAASDFIIGCDSSGGAFTITLPSPGSTSQLYIIKDEKGAAAAHNVTVSAGAKTIDGVASVAISANFGVVRAYTDGSNWFTW